MAEDNGYTPPKASKGDIVHAAIRAGLGTIPLAGATATELFNLIVTPPLEKRRAEWMLKVGEALRKLEEKLHVNLENLQKNDEFIDIAMHATQAAIRNSQKEELDALRNAILNSALPHSPDESVKQMFINFIDVFTVWHLKILDLVQDPEKWAKKTNHTFPSLMAGGFSTILESAFPELRGRRDFFDQIGKDLAIRGLSHTDNFHVTMTGHGLMQKRTTDMGDKFLKFISDPTE